MLVSVCETCGALLDVLERCPYDVPEASAPWRGDYAAMHRGEMSHAEHARSVARWGLHNEGGQSSTVLQRFRALSLAAWGARAKTFPRDD
jgi:hypothetical protein